MNTNTNPPMLGQTQPTYPPPMQLIRVTGTTVSGPSGFAQVAGSSVLGPTLYVAFVQQLRDDGSLLPRDREPCLADDVNGLGLTPGFYLGRLSGTWTSLPVYEITAIAASSGGGSSSTSAFACVGVATANVASLSGTPATQDGVGPTAGMFWLLAGQSTESQNGPWTVQSGAWTRPPWYASGSTIPAGFCVNIADGTVFGGSQWYVSKAGTGHTSVIVDSDNSLWTVELAPLVGGGYSTIATASCGGLTSTGSGMFGGTTYQSIYGDKDAAGVWQFSTYSFFGFNTISTFGGNLTYPQQALINVAPIGNVTGASIITWAGNTSSDIVAGLPIGLLYNNSNRIILYNGWTDNTGATNIYMGFTFKQSGNWPGYGTGYYVPFFSGGTNAPSASNLTYVALDNVNGFVVVPVIYSVMSGYSGGYAVDGQGSGGALLHGVSGTGGGGDTFVGGIVTALGGSTLPQAGTGITITGTPATTVNVAPTIPQAENIKASDSGTTNTPSVITMTHDTSGTPAAGFGATLEIKLQDTGGPDKVAGDMTTSWVNPTDGAQTSRMAFFVYNNTTAQEFLRGEAGSVKIGFLGHAAAPVQSGDPGAALVAFGLMSSANPPTTYTAGPGINISGTVIDAQQCMQRSWMGF